MTTHTDPVCGMTIDDQAAALQSTHQGTTYHFCGEGCKTKFEEHPEQYAKKAADA